MSMKAKEKKTSPTKSTKSSVVAKKPKTVAVVKKPIRKTAHVADIDTTVSVTESAVTPVVVAKKRKVNWLVLAWVLVVGLALFYFRGQFVVALVNGQPIFRSSLVRELERQSGQQVLDTLILKTVIMQEATKQKVSVAPTEVDEEIVKLEETFKNRGQDLASALAVQGMTQADLKEQMMLQKLVEKMVDQNVEVTDDEVKKYMEENKSFLPKDAKPDELKAEIKSQLEQQKKTTKVQEWVTKLKDEAKVEHWLFQ